MTIFTSMKSKKGFTRVIWAPDDVGGYMSNISFKGFEYSGYWVKCLYEAGFTGYLIDEDYSATDWVINE